MVFTPANIHWAWSSAITATLSELNFKLMCCSSLMASAINFSTSIFFASNCNRLTRSSRRSLGGKFVEKNWLYQTILKDDIKNWISGKINKINLLLNSSLVAFRSPG